jgi:hypothetical protein
MTIRVLCTSALLAITLNACLEDSPDLDVPDVDSVVIPDFDPPTFTESDRKIDTLFSVDFDDDGVREYVVGSIRPTKTMPGSARADWIEIYRYDTAAEAWNAVVSDTLLWGTSYRLRELTGDRAPELVVDLFAGGNDPVASRGLFVYTGHGGSVRRLLGDEEGAPAIESIDTEPLPVVVTYQQHWPKFIPHARAITYVDDIVSLEGGKRQSVLGRNRPYFVKRARELQELYRSLLSEAEPRDTNEDGTEDLDAQLMLDQFDNETSELYLTAAQTIFALDQADERAELRQFWHSQSDTLRRILSVDEYDLLAELYTDHAMR